MENRLLLLIAFAAFVVSMNLTSYVLPFIYPRVIDEFGWSREQATLIASIKFLFGVPSTILAGRLSDKLGPWPLLIGATTLGGLSLVAFLWLDGLALYYAIGIVQGIVVPGGYVALIVVLSQAYARSFGSATGVALMGSAICSVVVPIAVVYAMQAWGWRTGAAAMSAGIWLVALPLMTYGAFVFGRRRATGRRQAPGNAESSNTWVILRGLARSRDFWLIAVAILLAAVADQAFRQHQVLIFQDLGLAPATAAFIISGIGVTGVVTRILAGNILDARSNRGLALLFVAEAAASLLAFFLTIPGVILLFVLFRATSQSAITLDAGVMAKHIFGPNNVGAVIGILAAFGSLGSALGPWMMGILFDTFGSYRIAFGLFIVLPLVGAMLTWRVTPHHWLSQNAKPSA